MGIKMKILAMGVQLLDLKSFFSDKLPLVQVQSVLNIHHYSENNNYFL